MKQRVWYDAKVKDNSGELVEVAAICQKNLVTMIHRNIQIIHMTKENFLAIAEELKEFQTFDRGEEFIQELTEYHHRMNVTH